MELSYTNNYPNILFQSDNIHISKMIVDKTVDKSNPFADLESDVPF